MRRRRSSIASCGMSTSNGRIVAASGVTDMYVSWSIVASSEELQEEEEDVEDVEEDAGRDRHRGLLAGAAKTVEVEDGVAAEDHEPGDRPDQVLARDRDEDRDEPEHDQAEQRPEQDPVPRRQVAARGVAGRTESRHESTGGAGGLPDRRGIGVDIRAQHRAEGQPQ